jgi:Replication factor A protein 3
MSRQEETRLINFSLFLQTSLIYLNPNQIQGTTTDKKSIDVILDQPLNQPLEGWIEVLGKPMNAVTVKCSEVKSQVSGKSSCYSSNALALH